MELALVWALVVLVPINGLLFIGARNERIRNRRILMQLWRVIRR